VRKGIWAPSLALVVAIGAGSAVLLMGVAYGAADSITASVSVPAVRQSGVVSVDKINSILVLLTIVVTVTTTLETAAAAFVVSLMVMRASHEYIAYRRRAGSLPRRLILELSTAMVLPSLAGCLIGEAAAITIGAALDKWTDLPVLFPIVIVAGAVPLAVGTVFGAACLAAWRVIPIDLDKLSRGDA